MRNTWIFVVLVIAGFSALTFAADNTPLKVVTTLPDYAVIAKAIGGDRISVVSIVRGDQDAHFIRPKPSFVGQVRNADVLIATGLDLELWVPTIVDKSGNIRVRSGQVGYISTVEGMHLLEKPEILSRAEGGLHIHGNPHMTCSPIQMKVAARNIAYGLIKNDPEGKEFYLKNLKSLHDEFDRRLFGEELIKMLGGKTLCDLAEKDKLIPFLKEHEFQEKPMIEYLGGWLKEMLPLRGTPIVTYHKNWIYFICLFGLEEAATIEPKPGIPPSPRHVTEVINLMRERKISIVLAANYFDHRKVKAVAAKVNAEPVIVPIYVGGAPGVDDYFQLVDCWIENLLSAAKKTGLL